MTMHRRLRQRGVARQFGLVEQAAGPVGGQRHEPLEIRQAGNRAQLSQVALQIGLHVAGEPEIAAFFRGGSHGGGETATQQPVRPVASFIRPIRQVEIRLEQAIQRGQSSGTLQPFRRTKRRQFQIDGASRQRFRDLAHQEQIGRTHEQKIARLALAVDLALEGQKQLRRALHFVQGERMGQQQGVGIGPSLTENAQVIQAEVVARFGQGTGQRSFAGLARAGQDDDWQRPQCGLQGTRQPASFNIIHAMIKIDSRCEINACTVRR